MVVAIVDGDTVHLESGETIRYLLVDTPELGDCFGAEARRYNRDLVLGRQVTLAHDVDCEDRYGRLLAYVSVAGREVNRLLVERGYACAQYIPPAGRERAAEFQALEDTARAERRGMWGSCQLVACD